MELESLCLPPFLVAAYLKKGIKTLYEWQGECLRLGMGVEGGEERGGGGVPNLIYCAPTSGGKTLVAEILMLKRLFSSLEAGVQRVALLVLPFVSLVSEKSKYLEGLLQGSRIRVRAFHGGGRASCDPATFDVAVCTLEKANALVNSLIEKSELWLLSSLVVDELHLLGDASRGYILELMLTKVLYFSRLPAPEEGRKVDCQIVGMSATLPNVKEVAEWVKGRLYITSFRPVELREYLAVGPSVYFLRKQEVMKLGQSVLVFCASKAQCEACALMLSSALPAHENGKRSELLQALQVAPSGLDPTLGSSVPSGVGFHHSGLTVEERTLVEAAYREKGGALLCLTATSTLAAGVNLPARRVIFKTPFVATEFIDTERYKQMSGRAGRAGQGGFGESIVLCRDGKEAQKVAEVASSPLRPLVSSLGKDSRGLQKLLLEVLSVQGMWTSNHIIGLAGCTLMFQGRKGGQEKGEEERKGEDYPEILESMKGLLKEQLVALDPDSKRYFATPVGRAVCASGLSCEDGCALRDTLLFARSEGLLLQTDLHLCFLIAPRSSALGLASSQVDWTAVDSAMCSLGKAEKKVAELGKVPLHLFQRAAVENRFPMESKRDSLTALKFLCALLLYALTQEVGVSKISANFGIPRGHLQSLQQAAGSFAAGASLFCQKMHWVSLEALLTSFSQRLAFGTARQELMPLLQMEGLPVPFAAQLHKAGLTTCAAVGKASPSELASILKKCLPPKINSIPSVVISKLQESAKEVVREIRKEALGKAREIKRKFWTSKGKPGTRNQPFPRHLEGQKENVPHQMRSIDSRRTGGGGGIGGQVADVSSASFGWTTASNLPVTSVSPAFMSPLPPSFTLRKRENEEEEERKKRMKLLPYPKK